MKSDYLRGITHSGRGTSSVPSAGYTGGNILTTGWIDVAQTVGPVTVVAHVESDPDLSGTLSLEHATSAAGAGAAVVTAEGDFAGGRDAAGANATGGKDFAVNEEFRGSLAYAGSRRYVRGRLSVANASSGAVAKEVSLVALVMPQVEPEV